MNSMSKGNWQDEKGCGCKKEKEKEAEVLLKCKDGGTKIITVTSAATVAPALAQKLVEVTIKTEHFSDPCIKFEFATNLVVTTTSTVAGPTTLSTLSFQLYKLCKGETNPTTIGNPWVYPDITAAGTAIISFIVCDCDCDCDCDKNDCCSYYVAAITSTTDTATDPPDSTIITFNNLTFSALVVEKNKRC